MTGWKKICCAVDFSEISRLALERAAALAQDAEAALTVVHVHAPSAVTATDVLVAIPDVEQREADRIGRELSAWRADAERLCGHTVKAVVLSGDPGTEVPRWAAENDIDLVVVGTHGRTGLRRMVLGSVAERIVRTGPCAVLTVRPGSVHARSDSSREEIAPIRR
jgi:nucleotide-binding universal stress UspA family protein